MLPRIRLLQVGDLHLPSAAKTARSLDQKDKTFSVELRNVISGQPIKAVFKRIYQVLESEPVDAVLLMGDMTDFGKLEGYQAGLAYVANALQLGEGRRHSSTFAGIVPGNHDIDRELAKQPSMTAKFAPLNAALAQAGLDSLPVERSVIKELGPSDARCIVVLMNSCWGCGALEYIPEDFRQTVGAAIETAIAVGDRKVLKAYYDRQFDTPTDPVEVMSIPGGDVLVCISAPAAESGFNILEIVFTRSGMPLVAHILPWSFDQSGILRQAARLTVPLIGRRRRSLDNGLTKVYSYLLNAPQCYWSDLIRDCGPFFTTDIEQRMQECIELLVADRSVVVENYDAQPISWILEARI
jgi:Calcineurin-like phosphoesterase